MRSAGVSFLGGSPAGDDFASDLSSSDIEKADLGLMHKRGGTRTVVFR
jgi:hypothetical protein